MRTIIDFAERRPGLYLGLCLVAGTLIRLAMAHGDVGKFMNPFWPLLG